MLKTDKKKKKKKNKTKKVINKRPPIEPERLM